MPALFRRQTGKLPDRRIELYERYVRTLIDNWRALTAIRRLAPLDAEITSEIKTGRFESLGLPTRFPGGFQGLHATVHRSVETSTGQGQI